MHNFPEQHMHQSSHLCCHLQALLNHLEKTWNPLLEFPFPPKKTKILHPHLQSVHSEKISPLLKHSCRLLYCLFLYYLFLPHPFHHEQDFLHIQLLQALYCLALLPALPFQLTPSHLPVPLLPSQDRRTLQAQPEPRPI